MKKIILISLIFVCGFLCFGCKTQTKFEENLCNYKMVLDYNSETKTLSGRQNFTYYNSEDAPITNLCFHLYPNAFREGSKQGVVSTLNAKKAYPNGFSYGDIQISQVKNDNMQLPFSICGEDENILNVELESAVEPNKSTSLEIVFFTRLANINHRLGYGDTTTNIFNFYPILCVYENNNFVCDLYHYNGDPFYSECANYEVELVYDGGLTLATGGVVENESQKDDKNIAQIKSVCVRDFGFVLSKNFECLSQNTNSNIKINYFYTNDENAQKTLETCVDSVNYFEQSFGKYPYSELCVTQTDFVHGGMEYPTIIMVSNTLEYKDYIYATVHEIAHQWWYGIVGNNEFVEGWIDEGLTEFSTLLYYHHNVEDSKGNLDAMINTATTNYANFAKIYYETTGEIDTTMNRGLNKFKTEPEYVYNTYVKGVILFGEVYDMVGEKNFLKVAKALQAKYAFKTITAQNVINEFDSVTFKGVGKVFESFIFGKVKMI